MKSYARSPPLHHTRQKVKLEPYELGESVYLNQDSIAKFFDISKSSISEHIANTLKEGELQADFSFWEIRTSATDAKSYKGT